MLLADHATHRIRTLTPERFGSLGGKADCAGGGGVLSDSVTRCIVEVVVAVIATHSSRSM